MSRLLHRLLVWGIVLAVLLPFVPLLIWSVSFRWLYPDVLPEALSARAWLYIFSPQTKLLAALGNSTLIALLVTSLSLLIGLPAGRALGLYRFRGKTAVRFFILAPTIMPTLAAAMGIHILFIRYGLVDSVLGVVLVHLIPVMPYVVLILSGVFANYNVDFEAQAQTLGASAWQRFRYITLPSILPAVMVSALFAFIISWSQYILTLLIGGGQVVTLPVLLFSFINSGDNAITAALSLVFMAPAVLFLFITARYLSGSQAALGGFGKL